MCNEDVSTGPCREWQTRFYFNKRSGTCEQFTYGGCQGSGNRFESRAECESLCIIGQEPKYTDTKGIASDRSLIYIYRKNFINVIPVVTSSDICKLQVDVGRCTGPTVTEGRWYYDDSRGNCVSFIYSGCAGNQNNFRTYESCYNYCASKPRLPAWAYNSKSPHRLREYEHLHRLSFSAPIHMLFFHPIAL